MNPKSKASWTRSPPRSYIGGSTVGACVPLRSAASRPSRPGPVAPAHDDELAAAPGRPAEASRVPPMSKGSRCAPIVMSTGASRRPTGWLPILASSSETPPTPSRLAWRSSCRARSGDLRGWSSATRTSRRAPAAMDPSASFGAGSTCRSRGGGSPPATCCGRLPPPRTEGEGGHDDRQGEQLAEDHAPVPGTVHPRPGPEGRREPGARTRRISWPRARPSRTSRPSSATLGPRPPSRTMRTGSRRTTQRLGGAPRRASRGGIGKVWHQSWHQAGVWGGGRLGSS